MADEVLTPAELEALLAARAAPSAAGPSAPPSHRQQALPSSVSSALSDRLRAAVSAERHSAAPRLGEAAVRSIAQLHQRLAVALAAEFAALVRRPAQVKLSPLSQASYREFVARLANPTCYHVVSAAPLDGSWSVEITPSLLFPAIDCMLGGNGRGASGPRSLTDIEWRLANRIVGVFLRQLSAVWTRIAVLELPIEQATCNPRALAGPAADDVLLCSRFELGWAEARGAINLAIPLTSLDAVLPQLDSAAPSRIPSRADAGTVELVACLARSTISDDDLCNLAVGDTLTTEQKVDEPIDVFAEGTLRFRARVGAERGHKALEIDGVVPPEKSDGR